MPENQLIDELRAAVGRRYLLTGSKSTERYRRGFRSGEGDAVAVAKPGTLLELSIRTEPRTLLAKLASPLGVLMTGPMKKMILADMEDLKVAVEQRKPRPHDGNR